MRKLRISTRHSSFAPISRPIFFFFSLSPKGTETGATPGTGSTAGTPRGAVWPAPKRNCQLPPAGQGCRAELMSIYRLITDMLVTETEKGGENKAASLPHRLVTAWFTSVSTCHPALLELQYNSAVIIAVTSTIIIASGSYSHRPTIITRRRLGFFTRPPFEGNRAPFEQWACSFARRRSDKGEARLCLIGALSSWRVALVSLGASTSYPVEHVAG